MTKKALVRCIVDKVQSRIRTYSWPPFKLTMWHVTAFLNGREDAFGDPSEYELVGIAASEEVSDGAFEQILKAAAPVLPRATLATMYSDFLEQESDYYTAPF